MVIKRCIYRTQARENGIDIEFLRMSVGQYIGNMSGLRMFLGMTVGVVGRDHSAESESVRVVKMIGYVERSDQTINMLSYKYPSKMHLRQASPDATPRPSTGRVFPKVRNAEGTTARKCESARLRTRLRSGHGQSLEDDQRLYPEAIGGPERVI
jgi:hypothetical protein